MAGETPTSSRTPSAPPHLASPFTDSGASAAFAGCIPWGTRTDCPHSHPACGITESVTWEGGGPADRGVPPLPGAIVPSAEKDCPPQSLWSGETYTPRKRQGLPGNLGSKSESSLHPRSLNPTIHQPLSTHPATHPSTPTHPPTYPTTVSPTL